VKATAAVERPNASREHDDAHTRGHDGPHAGATAEDRYLTLTALAAYSGLSVRTLQRHLAAAAHSLPRYRVGGRVLVRRSEFDAWMAEQRETVSAVEALVRQALVS
jgi:excisionase family DNA binding protein